MSLGCLWHSKRVQMQPPKRQARKVKYTLPVTYTKSSDIYLPWAILSPQHMLCYYYWVFSTSQHRVVVCVGAQLQQLHLAKDTSQNPNPGVAPLANMAQVCSNQGNEQAHSGLGLASELPNCCFWEVLQPSQENSLRKKKVQSPPRLLPLSKPGCSLSKEPTLAVKLLLMCYQAPSLCWLISQNPEINSTGKRASLLLSPELGLLMAGSVRPTILRLQADFQQRVQVDMSKRIYFVPLDTQSSPLN